MPKQKPSKIEALKIADGLWVNVYVLETDERLPVTGDALNAVNEYVAQFTKEAGGTMPEAQHLHGPYVLEFSRTDPCRIRS